MVEPLRRTLPGAAGRACAVTMRCQPPPSRNSTSTTAPSRRLNGKTVALQSPANKARGRWGGLQNAPGGSDEKHSLSAATRYGWNSAHRVCDYTAVTPVHLPLQPASVLPLGTARRQHYLPQANPAPFLTAVRALSCSLQPPPALAQPQSACSPTAARQKRPQRSSCAALDNPSVH